MVCREYNRCYTEVSAGLQRLEYQDVSAQVRPETVSLTVNDIGIVEQNFDFNLLTPAKLTGKAVGQTVTLVRVNPAGSAMAQTISDAMIAC